MLVSKLSSLTRVKRGLMVLREFKITHIQWFTEENLLDNRLLLKTNK
jgi:hypothetical protein